MNEKDVKLLCRTCFKSRRNCSNIYSRRPFDVEPIYEVINYVYDLEIVMDDGLPKHICPQCLASIKLFESYKRDAHRVKKDLMLLLEKNQVFLTVGEECLTDSTDLLASQDGKIRELLDETIIPDKDPLEEDSENVKDDCTSTDEQVHIKNEIDDEEFTAPEMSASLGIREIPTNDGLDIKEWSMFGEFSQYSKEKEIQENKNVGIPKAGPSKMGKRRGGRPSSKPVGGYVCDICKKCFQTKRNIGRHVVTHYKDRPYVCEKCDMAFKLLHQLTFHRMRHKKHEVETKSAESERNFKCAKCGRCYRSQRSLTLHSKAHTSKFACNICHKRFDCKSSLERHDLTHTNERPFKCGICDKSFNRKSHLQRHAQIHSDVMDFKCLTCDKAFRTRDNLTHHEIIHCR